MLRLASKAKTAVQKQLSPIVPVVALALVFALLVTALAVVTGLVEYVPSTRIPVTGWRISPRLLLLIVVFVLSVVIGVGYLAYRTYADAIASQWGQLSTWAQAMVTGGACGLLVAFGLGLAAIARLVPMAFILAGSLVAWPLATVLSLRQRREPEPDDKSSALQSLLVKTGYAQVKRLQTRTLAGIVGFVVAISGTVAIRALVAWFGESLTPLQLVLLVAFLWLVATVLVYNRYESTTSERTELYIVEVSTPASGNTRELTVKNGGTSPVDLANAKLRDTKRELHQFDVEVTLEPGERRSFEIPDTFSLEPNDTAMELPLGYTLKQGGEYPVVYTRTGALFGLRGGTETPDSGPDTGRSVTRSVTEPGLGSGPTPQE